MSKNIMLYELISKSADSILNAQQTDGSFPAGYNGVRFDPETPARNTGDWMITLLKVYSWTRDEKYLEPAKKALKYLLSDEIRPMGATIWHRKKPEKDFCNGLIGQAFTIEALCTAYEILGNDEARIAAESIFLLHPFDENVGAWQRVAVDGSYLPFDGTFNHQLCFAAAGAFLFKISGNEKIDRQLKHFLDRLKDTFIIYSLRHRGLIKHPLFSTSFRVNGLTGAARRVVSSLKQYNKKRVKHALGYHSFNMYAFALLYRCYPEHHFWKSKKFRQALGYMQSKDYINITESEAFSHPYSPAGFETVYVERAFSLETFCLEGNLNEIKRLLSKQFNKTMNYKNYMMEMCSADPVTQAARLYKATRLANVELEILIGEASNE